MDLGLSGKKAIVCASSRGLGRACAISLARAGVNVVINGRDREYLEETARQIGEVSQAAIIPVAADVSTPEGQEALLAACPEPDILVNNNGGPPFRDFRELDRQAMLDGVVMNMVTPIELIQKVIDGMIARKFGRIVDITSISVKMPVVGLDLSSGARAGLTAFMAGVARSVAHHNVTINHIQPGFFDTDRIRSGYQAMAKLENKTVEEVAHERSAKIPARRLGSTEEFGDLCAYLCGAQSGYITGQSILIDGGLYNSVL
ncbi:MAG: 3-oxoacyl-ACP reductase [Hyphomicrobiales bacterium]|nr:MAG: 3-oxoacyl-ACP reductase [Hyphomicrobiales bacterium]